MTAGEMSDGSPVTPQYDARMLAEIREWRSRLAPTSLEGNRWSARLTIDELDMLLRVAAERDALKAAACAEWEADIPAEVRERAGSTHDLGREERETPPRPAGSTALGIAYAEPMHEPEEPDAPSYQWRATGTTWGGDRMGAEAAMRHYVRMHGGRLERRVAAGPWETVEA